MSLDKRQYDYRGTKPSWRFWKRFLKRQTGRKDRDCAIADAIRRRANESEGHNHG